MQRHTSRRAHLSSDQACISQVLERRTLLSAWGVVDDYQLAGGQAASGHSMATDAAGNVYAIGSARDSNGRSHGIVREKLAGSATWLTIEDYPGAGASGAYFYAVAADGAQSFAGPTAPASAGLFFSPKTTTSAAASNAALSLEPEVNDSMSVSALVDAAVA